MLNKVSAPIFSDPAFNLLNPCSFSRSFFTFVCQQSHAIHTASHQKGKKHTRCLTSYLDAVSVGCVHDSRNQVFSRLPVVISHPRGIPGQDQDPWSHTEQVIRWTE